MDDAFAGGVCRCQYCGTIQTVPSNLKGSAAAGTVTAGKSLYQGTSASNTAGGAYQGATGLYDLDDAVASSGLSSGTFRKPPAAANAPPAIQPAPPRSNRMFLLIGAAAIVAILLGVVAWMVLGTSTPQQANPNPSNPTAPTPAPATPKSPAPAPGPQVVVSKPPVPSVPAMVPSAPAAVPSAPAVVAPAAPVLPAGPHFLAVPIKGNKVVYVIDRGDSIKPIFDGVKEATFKSIESLGPNRQFAIVFWGPPRERNMRQWSFPDKGVAPATPQQVQSCRDKFANLDTASTTDVTSAIRQAYSLKPDMIFLMTAKGSGLEDRFGRSIDSAGRNYPGVNIYTIDLANGAGQKVLEPIANKSHGTYTSLSPADVRP
jgi:hypothetical protein